jgi:hypothetical protein
VTYRYYSSTAASTTLSIGCNSSAATITVVSTTGFPTSYPYSLILDMGTASEEIVDVTGASGAVLNVTRGRDSTTGVDHAAGATVTHGTSARDFKDSRDHEAASSAVHGTAGTVVGTSDSQTLSNKTLSSPILNSPTGTNASFNASSGTNQALVIKGGTSQSVDIMKIKKSDNSDLAVVSKNGS